MDIPIEDAAALPIAANAPDRNPASSSWKIRRRLMFMVTVFCMASISWALYKNTDTKVMEAAVTMGFGTMSAITGSYVFGAVWEDSKK